MRCAPTKTTSFCSRRRISWRPEACTRWSSSTKERSSPAPATESIPSARAPIGIPAAVRHFADYDLVFRYPRRLTLVTPGDIVSDTIDGDWRVTERRTPVPIRVAGFNLGDYEKISATAAGLTVDVFGNRSLDPALQPPPKTTTITRVIPTGPRTPPRRRADDHRPERAAARSVGAAEHRRGGCIGVFPVFLRTLRPSSAEDADRVSDPGHLRTGISGPGVFIDACLSGSRGAASRRRATPPCRRSFPI